MKKTSLLLAAGCMLCSFVFAQPGNKLVVLEPVITSGNDAGTAAINYPVCEKVKALLMQEGYRVMIKTFTDRKTELPVFVNENKAAMYIGISASDMNASKWGKKVKHVPESYRIIPCTISNNTNAAADSHELAVFTNDRFKKYWDWGGQARVADYSFGYNLTCPGYVFMAAYKPFTALQRKLTNEDFQQQLAASIATSVREYFGKQAVSAL